MKQVDSISTVRMVDNSFEDKCRVFLVPFRIRPSLQFIGKTWKRFSLKPLFVAVSRPSASHCVNPAAQNLALLVYENSYGLERSKMAHGNSRQTERERERERERENEFW